MSTVHPSTPHDAQSYFENVDLSRLNHCQFDTIELAEI